MKIGIRKPSIKKSISARTTGKVKRKLKRVVNPLYGKKGMGFIKNPAKAIKGKIYRKTTVSAKNVSKGLGGCLWACCVIPFYLMWYTLVLMWYMMKYMVLGLVWLSVTLINGCIALVEWCINMGRKNHSDTISTSGEPTDTIISDDSSNLQASSDDQSTPV